MFGFYQQCRHISFLPISTETRITIGIGLIALGIAIITVCVMWNIQKRNEKYQFHYYMLEHRKKLIMDSNIEINKLKLDLLNKEMHDIHNDFSSLKNKISTEERKLKSYYKGYEDLVIKMQKEFGIDEI